MTKAVRDWSPSRFRACGLRFEPRIIQRDDGETMSYELACAVYRNNDNRAHRASRDAESAEDVEEKLQAFVRKTVDTACLIHRLEDDIEEVLLGLQPAVGSEDITRATLGELRLHEEEQGYTIHIDAEAVKRPDGFAFASSGWLGSDESDSIIATTEEASFETVAELADGVEAQYEQLLAKRETRVEELQRVSDAVDAFSPPDVE